ncbi:MAG: porin [bacterium]
MTPRIVLALALTLGIAHPAVGQSDQSIPSFDLLKAAHGADSLRRVTARQQAEFAKLSKANSAKSDTIVRQRRELEKLRAMLPLVDSVARGGPVSRARDTASAEVVLMIPAAVVVAVSAPEPATAAAPAAPVAPATSVPTPAAAPRAAWPSLPALSGLLQLWISGGDAGFRNTYRLRRAEVRASGATTPLLSWTIMLDLGKTLSATSVTLPNGTIQTAVSQNSRALQDAAIFLQASPTLRIDVGQQKIPFGLEGAQSSGTLETVERSLFASDRARGGSFGDMRDIGVALRGRWTSALDYQVGAFNGSGEAQNDVDANLAKAIIGRVAFRPMTALQFGVSGVYAGTTAADAPRRDRDGVDVRFRSGKLLLQAEAVAGHDALLSRRGMYALASYRALPMTDLHARFDAWDPDTKREADTASATERDYLAGFTWTMPAAGLKTQADVVRRTYSSALAPSRWQLLINLQTSW